MCDREREGGGGGREGDTQTHRHGIWKMVGGRRREKGRRVTAATEGREGRQRES